MDPRAARYEGKPKYKYLLPLDGDIVERLKQLSKPYPKMRRKRETSLRQTSSLEMPGKHRARRSNHESYWNASTFGGIVLSKSTQVFNEAHTPTTTLASLPYSFSDFVDFSTVKENSLHPMHFSTSIPSILVMIMMSAHFGHFMSASFGSVMSDLPWTANCGPGG